MVFGSSFSEIKALTDKNLKNNIIRYDGKLLNGLIIFYADWCGHCKTTKPIYNEAYQPLRFDEKISFYRVDCTEKTDDKKNLINYCNAGGYPTIVKIVDGKLVSEFNQERTEDNFICFALGFGKHDLLDEDRNIIRTIKCPHINR
jgi:thiol-disulfide isomerase/thioredoxin